MRFAPELIEEIRYRNSIEDVISGYVTLKRAGSNLQGLCPFHSEKSPSFTVFPATGSFYCFGCNAGGDIFTFIMKAENLDYAGIFDDLFEKYTVSHKLNRVRTTNMGSLYELNYDIALTNENAEKEFIDAIRCRNGNLTVICGRKDYNQMEEL